MSIVRSGRCLTRAGAQVCMLLSYMGFDSLRKPTGCDTTGRHLRPALPGGQHRRDEQAVLGWPADRLGARLRAAGAAAGRRPGRGRHGQPGAGPTGRGAPAGRRRRPSSPPAGPSCAAQRDALVGALARPLPEWRVTVPRGGVTLWAELDGPISSALARAAEEVGVRLAPGPRFGLDGTLERFLRLPFTLPAADLVEAVGPDRGDPLRPGPRRPPAVAGARRHRLSQRRATSGISRHHYAGNTSFAPARLPDSPWWARTAGHAGFAAVRRAPGRPRWSSSTTWSSSSPSSRHHA